MSEGNPCWCRRSVAAACAFLVGACFVPAAHGDPLFSYTVGQSFQAPSDGDPGPYSPLGFPLTAGNDTAGNAMEYPEGATLVPVPDGGWQAVLMDGAQATPVPPLSGDSTTWAMTINSLGDLVGNSTTSTQNSWIGAWQDSPSTDHAIFFSLQGGTIALNTLDGTSGLPMGINNLDQIVGESYTAQGTIHGFLTMPGGTAYDLNSLIAPGSGYTILAGIQINDQGQIKAMASGPNGLDYYLTLTPNEPISTLFAGVYTPPAASTPPTTPTPPTTSTPPTNPATSAVPEPGPIDLVGLVGAYALVKSLRGRSGRRVSERRY